MNATSFIPGATGVSRPAVSGEVTQHSARTANPDVFMRLLVAQLQYQNPMKPADGVEFMTQLTQFSQLEQTIGMRQELARIREFLEGSAGNPESQP